MLLACALLFPALAFAQASLTGTVRDASGAILPGVTVEAASPVLIEKVRTTVTEGNGQFTIVNLRPGTYTVTFTLPGFQTIRQDAITLTGSSTTWAATTEETVETNTDFIGNGSSAPRSVIIDVRSGAGAPWSSW